MKNPTTKVSFELDEKGKAEVNIIGRGTTVKAGLMTIIEKLAEIEEVKPTELIDEMLHIAHMKEEYPLEGLLGGLFEAMFGGGDFDEDDDDECDGDCENCQEMPQELKDLFDRMFGGNK